MCASMRTIAASRFRLGEDSQTLPSKPCPIIRAASRQKITKEFTAVNRANPVHVAVGVLLNEDDEVLVALRSAELHQGGLWEFPGGKVEPGESVESALAREFEEELGINISACSPMTQIRHDYVDKSVLLDVWRVREFEGSPEGREGQPIEWRAISDLKAKDFPQANERIIRVLRLPARIAVTPDVGEFEQVSKLIEYQIEQDLQLIYFRQTELAAATYLDWYARAEQLSKGSSTRLMFCPPSDRIAGFAMPEIQALHITSKQLQSVQSRPTPRQILFSVSCHNLQELQKAEEVDADFAFLSPVSATDKYSSTELLGWDGFRNLAGQVNMPVFALGGMSEADLAISRAYGAFGIAGISTFLP